MKAPGTRERPEGEYTMLPMQNEIPRCEIWPRWGRRYPTTKKVKLQTFWNAWISSRSRSFNSDPPTAESRGLRRLEIYNVNLFKLNVLLIFKIKIVSWNDFVINDYTRKLNYVNFVIRFFLSFFLWSSQYISALYIYFIGWNTKWKWVTFISYNATVI